MVETDRLLSQLPSALLPWYAANRRELPWRADREAYHIWLSEIMLQQTRVEAVKGYYARFLAALPTVAKWGAGISFPILGDRALIFSSILSSFILPRGRTILS